MIQDLYKEFSQLEQVEAIALGGSRAGQDYDQNSDYDVYVYLNSPIDEKTRQIILSNYCSYMEIGNQFWELEDDCVLNNGIEIELIYRSLESCVNEINATVFNQKAPKTYKNSIWDNKNNTNIIKDQPVCGIIYSTARFYTIRMDTMLRSKELTRFPIHRNSKSISLKGNSFC